MRPSAPPATRGWVVLGGETFDVDPETPLVFGRADQPGVIGMDATDMGISAESGALERRYGVWWLVNRSRKRRLLVELRPGQAPIRLDCGDRQALTTSPVVVLVPGAVYTHRLEVHLPAEDLLPLQSAGGDTTGTITNADLGCTERDLDALTALCAGYLRSFPRHDPRPSSYGEAAELLGGEWTPLRVRKQVERVKERLKRQEHYFEGPRANYLLAEFLLDGRIVSPGDLDRRLAPG